MNIKLQTFEKKNNRFFNRLGSLEPLMKELSLKGLSTIQKNVEKGIEPENAPLTQKVKRGKNTLKDTGRLRASLTAKHNEHEAIIGTNVRYARIQQEGGVIKPVRAKALCIPASPKTRIFQRRYGFSAREVIEGLKKNDWSVFQPVKNGRRGNVIKAQRGNEEPFTIFILKKSVTIPARPFMFLNENEIEKIERLVADYFEEQV